MNWAINQSGNQFQKDLVSDSLISCKRKADSPKNMRFFLKYPDSYGSGLSLFRNYE